MAQIQCDKCGSIINRDQMTLAMETINDTINQGKNSLPVEVSFFRCPECNIRHIISVSDESVNKAIQALNEQKQYIDSLMSKVAQDRGNMKLYNRYKRALLTRDRMRKEIIGKQNNLINLYTKNCPPGTLNKEKETNHES